jgi:thiamine biosynthesis protein ThiS
LRGRDFTILAMNQPERTNNEGKPGGDGRTGGVVTANGLPVEVELPCSLEQFLLGRQLLPRSVVVEHNGEAVAPSEFSRRLLRAGDRLEIVKIVAGG